MSCEHVKELLFDYLDGQLNLKQSNSVKQHLSSCRSCREIHDTYLDMQKNSKRWQDSIVPKWNRNGTFIGEKHDGLNRLAWASGLSLAISVFLVIFNISIIYEKNKLVISFGNEKEISIVEKSYLDEKLNELEQRQLNMIAASMGELRKTQSAETKQIAKVILDYVDRDRDRDMTRLINYMESQRQLDKEQLDYTVDYLIRSQIKDQQDLGTLNQLILYDSLNQGDE